MNARSGRPFAVFDIDGTVIRWQLYHAVADELYRKKAIDPDKYQAVRNLRLEWKKRASKHSFDDYEAAVVKLLESSIKNIPVSTLQDAATAVLDEYKDQVYTYTRNLISELKASDYVLFAISGSQAEIVGPVAAYYGFDDYGGSVYETDGGRFTGRNTVLKFKNKPEYLKGLVEQHQAVYDGSIGIGDSEGDISMLELVEHAIAFNPTEKLYTHARSNGWDIVIERKNVIYELEKDNGKSYRLKD